MECSIIQKFKGEINGILIEDENNYCSTSWLLDQIEEKFGEIYNQDFVKDLSKTIETMYFKYDSFSYADLEHQFMNSINEAEKFNEIEFNYFGSTWKIEGLNEEIKNNKYEKSLNDICNEEFSKYTKENKLEKITEEDYDKIFDTVCQKINLSGDDDLNRDKIIINLDEKMNKFNKVKNPKIPKKIKNKKVENER